MGKKIKIQNPIIEWLKPFAIEIAGMYGFFSQTIDFPIINNENPNLFIKEGDNCSYKQEEEKIIITLDKTQDYNTNCQALAQIMQEILLDQKDNKTPEDFKNAPLLKRIEKEKTLGLENLFTVGPYIKDQDGDLLPEEINIKIKVKPDLTDQELYAAVNIAARLGMETLEYNFPILKSEDWTGKVIEIEEDESTSELRLYEDKILLSGNKIDEFSAQLCNQLPYTGKNQTLDTLLTEIENAQNFMNLDGQKVYLNNFIKQGKQNLECYFTPNKNLEQLRQETKKAKIYPYTGLKEIYKKIYRPSWEIEETKNIFYEEILPIINENDSVEIHFSLSEDKIARENLTEIFFMELMEKCSSMEVNSICSYKQGFSWINEHLIPKLSGRKVEQIKIKYRPFLPEGKTDWQQEHKTIDEYITTHQDKDRWLDLPIRWLQELYPIDDVLSQKLGIPKENITFEILDDDTDDTYLLQAIKEDGSVDEHRYKVHYSERPYLEEYPEIGKIHPSTGFIQVKINGKIQYTKNIKTDLEKVWDIYQQEILPYCKNHVLNQLDENQQNISKVAQLRLDMWISEPNYKLKIRQEQISSLEGFQEDLYFAALNYFKALEIKNKDKDLNLAGVILPVINNFDGAPRVMFTLYQQEQDTPAIIEEGEIIQTVGKYKRPYINRITKGDRGLKIGLEIDEELDDFYYSMSELTEEKQMSFLQDAEYIQEICYGEYIASVPQKKEEKTIDINQIEIPESTIINYEKYIEIIEQLKRVPELRVIKIGESYHGREIYQIQFKNQNLGYTSHTKTIDKKPVQLITARHYGNEISGTNSVFMTIKELITNPENKEIIEKINLVFIPMENPDGAEVHNYLQKDNPTWKLYAAKYNMQGKEITNEYYNHETICNEAAAFTKVWENWLPDVIIDNRGVPSHEWEQQFSGYTPHLYKNYWLPKALIYSYQVSIEPLYCQKNTELNKIIQDKLVESIDRNNELKKINDNLRNIFIKYANTWMPEIFKVDYHNDILSYCQIQPYSPDSIYASIRYPWITTANIILEVADETAHDDYLYTCTNIRKIHNMAVINTIKDTKTVRIEKIQQGKIISKRQRPIIYK